jgi:hypothetical protein
MLKQVTPESMQINFQESTKILSRIFRLGGKSAKIKGIKEGLADGKEDSHFLSMLKAGLASLDGKETKATAVNGMHDIHNKMGKGSDIEKKDNLERKQEMISDAQVSKEKIDEHQVDGTGIPAGIQSDNNSSTDNDVVQDRLIEVAPEERGENNAVGLQYLTTGIGTQDEVLISFETDIENGVPFSPNKEQLKDINNIVSNALQEKGIDENDISKILAVIKEEELKSVPLARQVGEVMVEMDSGVGMLKGTPSDSENGKISVPESLLAVFREKGIDENNINKILTVIKEGELKSVPLQRPVGEAMVEKDSGIGMLKGTPSDSENGKISVPESLLTAFREKGIDENNISKILAVIKEGELKSVPLERQVGEATVQKDSGVGMLQGTPFDSGNSKVAVPESLLAAFREKGIDENNISKILAVIKEGELKSVPLERPVGEAMVEKDSGVWMLKGMASDSNAEKGDSSGKSPSFSGKGKVIMPEPFMLAEQADLTAYISDSKVIRSGDNAKPIEDHMLVSQIASQLPSGVDKSSGRVKIILYPEHLGSLDMDIIFRENKVQVVLMAEHHDVRQELQNRGDQLRNALQEQGLQVDGIDFLLRQSHQEMNDGSGGSHLWWHEDNGSAKEVEKERDMPVSSVTSLLVTGKTGGMIEGGISLFI